MSKRITYYIPGGTTYDLYRDMAAQPHLLIAGATGSGKSVVINGILDTMLRICSPAGAQLVLIDPKRVELAQYKAVPHTIAYASEPSQMIQALSGTIGIIERRYKRMAEAGLRMSEDGDVYVIIDELADLMTTNKKQVQPLLQRICQIGRAARVHVIAATQCPLVSVIPTPIKVNFDARVGLRTRSAQDSRNILGVNGCEQLPRYGQGFYMTPEGMKLYKIPYVDPAKTDELIRCWAEQADRKHRRQFK